MAAPRLLPHHANAHPRKFDDAKLQQMVAPLNVRVERLNGAKRSPIPLPSVEDGVPSGTNWEIDNVREIEEWLVREWSGGGNYEITVTDSSSPPQTMTWAPFFDDREYPQRTPPPLMDAKAQYESKSAQPQQQVTRMGFSNGLPPGPPPPQGYYPQPYYAPQPAPAPQAQPAWQAQASWQASEDRRRMEEENNRLRQEAMSREREAAEARHRADLERERQANETRFRETAQQMSELRSMLERMAQNQVQAAQPNHTQDLERRLERERAEREAEKRDQAIREMMRDMAAQHVQTIAEMNRRFEAVISMIKDNGNQMSPMVGLVQQLQRDNADTLKEIARQGTEQIGRMQSFMMSPRDMFAMAKDANSGAEQATERMSKFFSTVVEMQQRVAENMLSMQPQGSAVADIVRDGIGTLKDVAERYVGAKSASERVQVQAQAQVAMAQAEAVKAQAMAQAAANSPIVTPPPAPQAQIPAQTGLSGAPQPMRRAKNGAQSKAQGAVNAATNGAPKRLGKTDVEWFGPLISEVELAREGVARFLDSCSQNPPRVNPKKPDELDGTSPQQLAEFIIQAAQMVGQANIPVPALVDLLMVERFADFVDVLVPNANQPYRDDTVQALVELIKHVTGETPNTKPAAGDEDLDEEIDEEEYNDEDDEDGVAVKPASTAPTRPAARA